MIDLDKRTAANPAGWAEIDRLRAERADLLEALVEARDEIQEEHDTDADGFYYEHRKELLGRLNAAIAKAEGRQ